VRKVKNATEIWKLERRPVLSPASSLSFSFPKNNLTSLNDKLYRN